jgi:magnesium-transporting ATPase (P-type)
MVLYNGFYTKIMQRNYNQSMMSRDLVKMKKSTVYKQIDKIALGCFIGSLIQASSALALILFSGQDLQTLMIIRQESAVQTFFFELGLQLHYAFELIPISLYLMYDLACFIHCLQLENSFSKTWNAFKAKIKGYYTAIAIKFKKRGKRADKRSSKRQSTGIGRMRSKETVRSGQKRPTITLDSIDGAVPSNRQIEMATNSPYVSDRNIQTSGVSRQRSMSKTQIKKTTMIRNSDITAEGGIRDYAKVIDFNVVSDLGLIDHVVFDKTDTLTTSHLEIVKFATLSRCYQLDCSKIPDKLIEIKTPGNNLAMNDSQDEMIKESEEYSEKSQEYLNEIIGDYKEEVCDEDSSWTAMLKGLEHPSYNLEIGYQHASFNNDILAEDSPMLRNNLNVSGQMDQQNLSGFGKNRQTSVVPIQVNGNVLNLSYEASNNTRPQVQTQQKVAARSGVLDFTNMKTRTVIIKDGENSSSKIIGIPDISDHKSDDKMSLDSESFKMTLKPNKELPLDKFIRDVYFKREDIEHFFAIATLFNRFTLEGERKFKCQSIEDKAISDLLKNLGYVLSESKKNKEKDNNLDLEFRVKNPTTNHTVDFEVMGVNFFSHTRERASIVFVDLSSSSNDAYLFVKGVARSMTSIMNMNEKEKNILRELSANYKSAGLKQLIYGIKKMEAEDIVNYRNSYMEIMKSTRDQKEAFELLAQDIEKDIKFLGCFGIRDTICPEGMAFSNLVRSIGIKFSILSGDSKENCLNVARALELTKSGSEENGLTFNITSNKEEDISSNMKRILDQIYEDIKKLNQEEMKEASSDAEVTESTSHPFHEELKLIKEKLYRTAIDTENELQEEAQEILDFEFDPMAFKNLTKRTLILFGPAINIIVSNPILLRQLRTVLLFCSSIVGYSMQPGHKATIVKLLRGQNSTVLAVGDGFNDIRMIREANVGVQLSNIDVPVAFSDLIVGSIEKLSQIMFVKSCNFNRNLLHATFALTWVNLGHVAFYYPFYYLSSLYSEPYFPQIKVEGFVVCILLSVICVTDSVYSADLMDSFPILYREQVRIKNNMILMLFFSLAMTALEVVMIILTFQFVLMYSLPSTGHTYGIKHFENFLVIVTSINSSFKIWLCRQNSSFGINLAILAIPFGLILSQYLLGADSDVAEYSNLKYLVSDYSFLASMAACIFLPCSFFWVVFLYAKTNFTSFVSFRLHRMVALIENNSEKKSTKKVSSNELRQFLFDDLKDFYQRMTVGRFLVTNIIRVIWKVNSCSQASKNPSITKILSADLFNYQFGIKNFTNYITERVDRRKFKSFLVHLMRKYSGIQLIIYLICFSFALVVGVSYSKFSSYYMMDTTIPYMIIAMGTLLFINKSKAYHTKQHHWTICMGVFSSIITLIFSAISTNTFELNMLDLFNCRIWFTVSLEMFESIILVGIHLVIRVSW